MSPTTVPAVEAPFIEWAEFWPMFRRKYERAKPYEAQHVTVLGPTRTGKSVLAAQVAALRPYVFATMTKPKDEPMRRLLRSQGYRLALEIPEPQLARRVAIWPKFTGNASKAVQRAVFGKAFDDGFAAGIWHAFVDEGHYVCKELRLGEHVRTWSQQGASNGNGLILCAQRPAWLPKDIYSARHLFLFGTNASDDLASIGGLNGADERAVRRIVANLGRQHHFLYIDTADGTMAVSRYEPTK